MQFCAVHGVAHFDTIILARLRFPLHSDSGRAILSSRSIESERGGRKEKERLDEKKLLTGTAA